MGIERSDEPGGGKERGERGRESGRKVKICSALIQPYSKPAAVDRKPSLCCWLPKSSGTGGMDGCDGLGTPTVAPVVTRIVTRSNKSGILYGLAWMCRDERGGGRGGFFCPGAVT